MRKAVLFLTGRYHTRDLPFYRQLTRGCFKVAVDGGYRFFERSGLVADLLIGDFDSLKYCLDHGILKIDLVQPSVGDPDHFLANLFLLTRASRRYKHGTPQLRLVGPDYEALLLSDRRITFRRARGSVVSVIPVSASIKLTCRGTAFDVTRVKITRGRTRSTRNRITTATAWFEIAGKAFLIRHFSRAGII
jgi:thiamine pyrophosphokinase